MSLLGASAAPVLISPDKLQALRVKSVSAIRLTVAVYRRLLANSTARLMAAIMLSGRAIPLPAISNAVP